MNSEFFCICPLITLIIFCLPKEYHASTSPVIHMIIRHQHDKGPISYYDSVLRENVMADSSEKWCYWLYS